MDADLFRADAVPARPCRERVAGWARVWLAPALGTLKLRLVLGGIASLLAATGLTLWQFGQRAQSELLVQARLHEQREAQLAAEAVGQRLDSMRRALTLAAGALDTATLEDAGRVQRMLERQGALRELFPAIFVTDGAGRMLGFVDAGGARQPQLSVADRDWFQQARAGNRPVLSDALSGRISDEPVVVLALPVRTEQGVAAVLGGALRLASRDLLRALELPPPDRPRPGAAPQVEDAADAGVGAADGVAAGLGSGTLTVLADAQGRILAHPARDRLLTRLDDEPRLAGAYRAWRADADAGRPGTLWRAAGGDVVTGASDPGSGWRIWRAVPEAQLLAGLQRARARSLGEAAALAGLLAAALLAFVAWQLRPLALLERRAAALLSGGSGAEWPQGRGEVGRLARTLRHVWAERAQVEAFNAEVLRKLGSVMSAAPVGLAFTRHGRFELVGDELCRMLGYAPGALVGQTTRAIFTSDDDWQSLGRQVGAAFSRGEPYGGEWRLQRADGRQLWGRLRARPVQPGEPEAGTIWSATDVSEQVAARQALEHAAQHDALTGVVNRQGFEHALQRVFDGQPATMPAALVMIDLDRFKPVNDSAGHAAGDAMLVAVARAIGSRVRGSDLVGRLGGDEFALLLPGCDQVRAMAVAQKVQQAIAELALGWDGRTLRVGASLGVAEFGAQHDSPAQWLAQADAACYEAKREGRGGVRLARPALRLLAGG
ncbi:MAG: diguanylate cyclase [Burkholderiales bacterium]|nr:diguanylate cyclase [Burkholderiales bacterium]